MLDRAWSWESGVTGVRLEGTRVWPIHTEGRGLATRSQDRVRRCHLDHRCGRAWTHLEDTVLGGRGQSPKATRCATALPWNAQSRQTRRQRADFRPQVTEDGGGVLLEGTKPSRNPIEPMAADTAKVLNVTESLTRKSANE